uniref:F-box protein At5g07610-like n=1 Tax=Elaeis guineensis var. tenera TaxID=51953 RepID=A0A6I9RU21_ELAGV|nr:F-box protein At5g07610-like [Elaeis guineensis]
MSPSSPSAVEVPSDLIAFEILPRLPAKSVLRFKSVCKQWLALASDPFFLSVHTRRNHLAVSGFLIQEIVSRQLSSFSVDGGASPVLPDPSLSSVYHLFAETYGFLVCQSCNGLLLCRSNWFLPSLILYLVNPTTMLYRQIPSPPADIYPIKYHFMLAFDPSTSFQYRIACINSNIRTLALDPTVPEYHVKIYSSDTGAWELSRETLPRGRIMQKGVYWNGALNWVHENGLLVSFDVDKQVVKTTRMPPRDHRGLTLYFGESRGHLHLIETVADAGGGVVDWLRFHVFEMGKDNPSWSLLYNVDLNGVRDVYPGTKSPIPYELALRVLSNSGICAVTFFFAREGEGEDDKLYFTYLENIFCYNLADGTCRKIFVLSPHAMDLDSSNMIIDLLPFAHSLFSP